MTDNQIKLQEAVNRFNHNPENIAAGLCFSNTHPVLTIDPFSYVMEIPGDFDEAEWSAPALKLSAHADHYTFGLLTSHNRNDTNADLRFDTVEELFEQVSLVLETYKQCERSIKDHGAHFERTGEGFIDNLDLNDFFLAITPCFEKEDVAFMLEKYVTRPGLYADEEALARSANFESLLVAGQRILGIAPTEHVRV